MLPVRAATAAATITAASTVPCRLLRRSLSTLHRSGRLEPHFPHALGGSSAAASLTRALFSRRGGHSSAAVLRAAAARSRRLSHRLASCGSGKKSTLWRPSGGSAPGRHAGNAALPTMSSASSQSRAAPFLAVDVRLAVAAVSTVGCLLATFAMSDEGIGGSGTAFADEASHGPEGGGGGGGGGGSPDRREGLVDISKLQQWNHNWDGRHHVSSRGKKTRYIVLIRHGHYHSDGADDSQRTLTPLGHRQAELLAQRLAQYHWTPTQISCSTLVRARQTTDHISSCSKFINVDNYVIDSKLREGQPFQPIPPARCGLYHKNQVHRDGSRIDAAFDSIFYRAGPEQTHNTYDIVVCHSNVIRYFVCRALQIPKEAWIRIAIPHCSITMLAIGPTGYVSLKCLGDSGFLPVDMVTTH